MDVPTLVAKLHLPPNVQKKAQELLRLSSVKDCAGTSQVCRPAICVQLAANECGEPLDKINASLCLRLSGQTKKIYDENLLSMRKLLNLEPQLGIKAIAVRFGLMEATERAEKLLTKFKDQLLSSQRKHFEEKHALYSAAILLLAVAQRKLEGVKFARINLQDIATACSCKPAEITKLQRQIEETLSARQPLEHVPNGNKSANTDSLDSEPSSKRQKKSELPEDRMKLPYLEWKARVLEETALQLGL